MVNIINPVMMLLMLFYLTTVETSDNFFSFSVTQGEKIVPLSHYAGKVKFSSIHFRPAIGIDLQAYNLLKCRFNFFLKYQRKQSFTKQNKQSTTFELVLGDITLRVPLVLIKVLRILAASSYCIVTLLTLYCYITYIVSKCFHFC